MSIYTVLRHIVLLSLLTVAAVTDLTSHKVNNPVTAAGFAAEGAIHLISPPKIQEAELTLGLMFILIIFMLFVFHLIGGADVKLYSLCVFTYPDSTGLRIIAVSIVLAAVYSVFLIFRENQVSSHCVSAGSTEKLGLHSRAAVPMAAFICAGAAPVILHNVMC